MLSAVSQFEFGTQLFHGGREVPHGDVGARNLPTELFQVLFAKAENIFHSETSSGKMREVNVARV